MPPLQVIGTAGGADFPGRNDICPCGSGLKFKRCHGLETPPAGVPVLGNFGTVPRAGFPWYGNYRDVALMTYLDAGAGDAIHAMRYVRPEYRYVVRPSMERLFSMSFPASYAWSRHPLPSVGVSTGSLDLIRANPPGALRAPYLIAPSPIAQDGRFHVGLCLRGDSTQAWDKWRSIRDERQILEMVNAVKGAVWHPLDKDGPGTPHFADWAETADYVTGLDVVVSVDTGVAHLAGALGVPLILLDRSGYKRCDCGTQNIHLRTCPVVDPGPDERWDPGFLQSGPLYAGGVHRIRQWRRGDWSGVADGAAAVLRGLQAERRMRRERRSARGQPLTFDIRSFNLRFD